MALIKTYVCDISGVNSPNREDFWDITISSKYYTPSKYGQEGYQHRPHTEVKKMVHKDVAAKLGFNLPVENPDPKEVTIEPSFENQLINLLRPLIEDEVHDAVQNARSGP